MFRYKAIILFIGFLTISISLLSRKTESFIIKNQHQSDLKNCIEIYTDSTNELNINQILNLSSEFILPQYVNNEIFITFSKYNHWLKFDLLNNHNKQRTVILQIKNPLIKEVELFSYVSNKLEKFPKSGTGYNFRTRQIAHRYIAYEIQLEPNTLHPFYLKIQNDSKTTNLPINLYLPSKYNSSLSKDNLFHGLFYGIIITILVITFLLWLSNIKEKGIKYYLWFFAYVLLIGMFNFGIDGYSFQFLWPNHPSYNELSIYISVSLGFFFLSRFTCDFFEIRKNNIIIYRIITVLGYAILVTIIFLFIKLVSFSIIIPYLILLVVLINLIIIYSSILFYKRTTKLSIYFITAFVAILIGVLSISSYVLGFGFPVEINNLLIKTSTIAQFIILTIALSAKMRIQQDIVYKQSITALQEAKELKEKLYSELEKKVYERTKELTATKNKIQEANQLIQNKNKDLEKAFKKSSNHYIKLQKALRTINEQKENLERANQEIQESSRLKEIFLANTSHEIRTPLNAIVGFTNLLLKAEPTQQQLKYIRNIKASGENLLVVINDILDFSKIEAGKLTFEETDFNIFELFDHIQETFKVKAEEKSIILENTNDEILPAYVNGDPVRLNQIFINLVGNAIKFTGKNGKVSFGFSLLEKQGDKLNISFFVEDTGIGISQENLENIFESFTQAESDTTRKYGGTGLGLSIVKQLIELQNGTIKIQSEVNKGTRFDFDLTYKVGKEHPTVKISNKTVEFSDCHRNDLSILIVEDNEVNQQLAKDTIKLWNNNIAIDIASNGNIAIQKSYESKYDLILMDIQMPQMDGFETTSIIRKEKESLNHSTPIVAMTAHAMKDEKENCINVGMNDYVSKPFDPDELFAKIKTFTCKKVVELIEKGDNIDYSSVICDKGKCDAYVKKTSQSKKIPQQQFASNTFIHIKLDHLNKLYQGDKEKIKKILSLYLESIPEELKDLSEGQSNAEWAVLKAKAHSLKPKLSYIGLNMASEYAKQIELFASKQAKMEIITTNIQKISEEWELASREIKTFINN